MPTIEQINRKKYLRAPTVEQIDEFIALCRVSAYQFEIFFGIPRGTIKVVRNGHQDLPKKYWHIFYEKVIPTYGTDPEPKFERFPAFRPTPKKKVVIEQATKPPAAPFVHPRMSVLK